MEEMKGETTPHNAEVPGGNLGGTLRSLQRTRNELQGLQKSEKRMMRDAIQIETERERETDVSVSSRLPSKTSGTRGQLRRWLK